eukprot:6113082-Amphidinium_carterae.1
MIKCRICVRGFQDAEAMDLDTYSGTTTKWGQRLVCSVAAQAGWSMCSFDISCAFLKGTSFSEIEASGGAKRTVFMDLPAGGHTLLRLIPGFESFDPATETLLMLKGGFGLKDAPRLWTMKVDKVFRSEGLSPLLGDEKLYALH